MPKAVGAGGRGTNKNHRSLPVGGVVALSRFNVVLRVLWFGPLHPETSESTPREALREVHDPKFF